MAKDIQDYMAKRKMKSAAALTEGLPDDPANKALDREFDAQFNLATHTEDVVVVDVNRLRPYSKHPFKVYTDDRLDALAESIARDGLQQPVILRAIDGFAGWEILAGHNRVEAVKRLGKRDIPAIIRELSDAQAAQVVVETNLKQREKLLPSEKAFAYKLQMEALQVENATIQNGDLPSDANGLEAQFQIETRLKGQMIADKNDDCYTKVFRYIRLTNLLPELLNLLDSDTIPVMAGYEVSFLDTDAQQEVYRYFFESGNKDKLSIKNTEAIRAAYQAQAPITCEGISSILHKPKKKPGPVTYRFSHKELKKRFHLPEGFDVAAFLYEKLDEAFSKA
jgi:ParB family chromosome partitioning protein